MNPLSDELFLLAAALLLDSGCKIGRSEMTECISVMISDPWKCQEVLREKLIPGRMKALGKSHSLGCCS